MDLVFLRLDLGFKLADLLVFALYDLLEVSYLLCLSL